MIDWILILCKAFTDGQGRRITNWLHPNAGGSKPDVQRLVGGQSNPPMAGGNMPRDTRGMIVAPAAGLMVAGIGSCCQRSRPSGGSERFLEISESFFLFIWVIWLVLAL